MALVPQQSSNSQSTSQTGNSHATASSSSSASSNGSRSASGNQQGFGSGSDSQWSATPTHAYILSPSGNSAPNVLKAHRDYLTALNRSGQVLLAGPWRDLPGEMIVIMVKSDDEANQIVNRDPLVVAGGAKADLRAWSPYLTPVKAIAR